MSSSKKKGGPGFELRVVAWKRYTQTTSQLNNLEYVPFFMQGFNFIILG